MAQTPHRRRLVPKAALIAIAVIVLLAASAAAAVILVSRSQLVVVPDVRGLTAEDAEARLAEADLGYRVGSTRVSVDVRAGSVIDQDRTAGTRVDPGTVVAVVLSVGPQSFAVPDLIGVGLTEAREALEALGLTVAVEAVSSESTEAAVLEMFPAPGAPVSPGDEVRLSVPGGTGDEAILLPYDLSGVTVLLDPQPAPGSVAADAPSEIARRLQSLLEASGATVASTRASSPGVTSPEQRVSVAASSAAAVIVGLDVGSTGTEGIRVFHLPPAQGDARASLSVDYARAITRAATLPSLVVRDPAPTNDPVLAAFPGTGVRVQVGDTSAEADRLRFGDPAWADQVARAIYRGLGPALSGE